MSYFVYSDILKGINDSWSIKEKVKYIYDEICKESTYDERLIYSTNPTLIDMIYNKKVLIDEPTETKLICKTLNSIFSQLLDRIGVKNRLIKKESNIKKDVRLEDISLIFYDEEGRPYFTSISADIQRCKYGMKTQFFGGCDNNYKEGARDKVTIIKADELKEIDIKTGYLQEGGIYSDEVFEMIASEAKQTNEFRKFLKDSGLHIVRAYLSEIGKEDEAQLSDKELIGIIDNFDLNELLKIKMKASAMIPREKLPHGHIENKKYFIELFKKGLFNKSEQKRYDSFDMVKESEDNLEIISILRFNLKPEPIYYIYSEEEGIYKLAPIEEIIRIDNEYTSKNGKKLIDRKDDDRGLI